MRRGEVDAARRNKLLSHVLHAIAFALFFLVTQASLAKSGGARALLSAVRAHRAAHEREILRELTSLLALPNVASDRAAIRSNALAIAALMERRGLAPELLELPGGEAPPLVFGECNVGAAQTLVFYAHYDGQPVNAEDWASDPWRPAWRDGRLGDGAREVLLPAKGGIDPEWRLSARSASDDKAGVIALLAAIDALKSTGLAPRVNVKLVFEGEEEAGSPHLAALLERHRARFGRAPWIVCDGPVHASGRKQVVYGVRGDVNVGHAPYAGHQFRIHGYPSGPRAPAPLLGQRLHEVLAGELGMSEDEIADAIAAGALA